LAAFGDPLVPESLWRRTSVSETGCWLREVGLKPKGYSSFKYQGKSHRAHRLTYSLLVGPIPEGLVLDHLCRVRNCVNPDHLEPVTQKVNVSRGRAGQPQLARTHCPHGHPYSGSNLSIHKKGGRRCKECARLYATEYRKTHTKWKKEDK
jgi:hypothetical protein